MVGVIDFLCRAMRPGLIAGKAQLLSQGNGGKDWRLWKAKELEKKAGGAPRGLPLAPEGVHLGDEW